MSNMVGQGEAEPQVIVPSGEEVDVSGIYTFLGHVDPQDDAKCQKHQHPEFPMLLKGMITTKRCRYASQWRLVDRIDPSLAYSIWRMHWGPKDDSWSEARAEMGKCYAKMRDDLIKDLKKERHIKGMDDLIKALGRKKYYGFLVQGLVTREAIKSQFHNVIAVEQKLGDYDVDIELDRANVQVWYGDSTKSELELFTNTFTENPHLAIARYRIHGQKTVPKYEWDFKLKKCVPGYKYNMQMVRKKLAQLPPNKLGILVIVGRGYTDGILESYDRILDEDKDDPSRKGSQRCIICVGYGVHESPLHSQTSFAQKVTVLSAPKDFKDRHYAEMFALHGVGSTYQKRLDIS